MVVLPQKRIQSAGRRPGYLYRSAAESKSPGRADRVCGKHHHARALPGETGKLLCLQEGTYGKSGLKIKENSNGSSLKYYKYGTGPNVYFATFAIHGWEDDFEHDGQELTKIANAFILFFVQKIELLKSILY